MALLALQINSPAILAVVVVVVFEVTSFEISQWESTVIQPFPVLILAINATAIIPVSQSLFDQHQLHCVTIRVVAYHLLLDYSHCIVHFHLLSYFKSDAHLDLIFQHHPE